MQLYEVLADEREISDMYGARSEGSYDQFGRGVQFAMLLTTCTVAFLNGSSSFI